MIVVGRFVCVVAVIVIAAVKMVLQRVRSLRVGFVSHGNRVVAPKKGIYYPPTTREIRACIAAKAPAKPSRKCSAEERILGFCS